MNLRLAPATARLAATDLVVCPVREGEPGAVHRDVADLVAAARKTGDVKTDFRRVATFHTGVKAWPRLATIGVGKAKALTVDRIRRLAALAQAHAERAEVKTFTLALPGTPGDLTAEDVGRAVAEGLVLGAHRHLAPRRGIAVAEGSEVDERNGVQRDTLADQAGIEHA